MLARPTTDQVLDGIVPSLTDDVLPTIKDEPARVAVQMILQLAASAAVRSAHEIAWMHDEIDAVRAAGTASADGPSPRQSQRSTRSTAPACTSPMSSPATTRPARSCPGWPRPRSPPARRGP